MVDKLDRVILKYNLNHLYNYRFFKNCFVYSEQFKIYTLNTIPSFYQYYLIRGDTRGSILRNKIQDLKKDKRARLLYSYFVPEKSSKTGMLSIALEYEDSHHLKKLRTEIYSYCDSRLLRYNTYYRDNFLDYYNQVILIDINNCTPKHKKRIKILIDNFLQDNKKSEINYYMSVWKEERI